MDESNIVDNELLDNLFPFYFLADESLKISKAGKGHLKLFPDIIGQSISSYFTFKRPASASYHFSSIIEYYNQIFILDSTELKGLLFRGQMIPLEKKQVLLFVGSPWIVNVDDLKKYNLLLTDFALHDTITDMLQIVKTKDIMMNDIKHLIVDLNVQKKELMKINELAEVSKKAKERFIANMSHEIRTPMNAIAGMAELLIEADMHKEHKEYAQAIKLSADNLMEIINDVLDFSKVNSGKIVLDEVDFNVKEILDAITQTLNTSAVKKNISLTYSITNNVPKKLNGDPLKLKQILVNLVGNAIKFTENGRIKIEVYCTGKTNGNHLIEFSVSDTGIGIEEGKFDIIFESFSQANNDTTRKYGGTGLGLSIVKKLIEMQGGNISVKSKLNEGSTFIAVIPYKAQDSLNDRN